MNVNSQISVAATASHRRNFVVSFFIRGESLYRNESFLSLLNDAKIRLAPKNSNRASLNNSFYKATHIELWQVMIRNCVGLGYVLL